MPPLPPAFQESLRVPGRGLSSPIAISKAIFVTTFIAEQNSRRLIRIDRETGNISWDVELHQGPVEQQHRFNYCASSTPAADSKVVYCMTVDNEKMWVVAVDFEGKQRWKVSPGSFGSQHGFAASPVLFEDKVIINGQQDGEAFIAALDKQSGETMWRYEPAVNLRSFSTPVIAKFDGQSQLVITGANQTVALSPSSGTLVWFVAGPNQKAVSTPSVADGVVFGFAGSPSEKAMVICGAFPNKLTGNQHGKFNKSSYVLNEAQLF